MQKKWYTLLLNAVIIIIFVFRAHFVHHFLDNFFIDCHFTSEHFLKWYYRLSATFQHMFPINAPPKTLFGHGFLWLRCDSKPLSGHLFAVASVSPWITSCFVQVSHIQVLKCKIPFIIFNVIFAPSISPFLMLRIYAISISCAFLRSGVTWAFAQHPTN